MLALILPFLPGKGKELIRLSKRTKQTKNVNTKKTLLQKSFRRCFLLKTCINCGNSVKPWLQHTIRTPVRQGRMKLLEREQVEVAEEAVEVSGRRKGKARKRLDWLMKLASRYFSWSEPRLYFLDISSCPTSKACSALSQCTKQYLPASNENTKREE